MVVLTGMYPYCSQENFEKSPAGMATRAQMAAARKQSTNSNNGEPVLKVSCIYKLSAIVVSFVAPTFHFPDILYTLRIGIIFECCIS